MSFGKRLEWATLDGIEHGYCRFTFPVGDQLVGPGLDIRAGRCTLSAIKPANFMGQNGSSI